MDFKYLVECKNEFNNYLSGILVPHIFHGIKGMFKYAENVYDQIEQKNKRGAKITNPGVVVIFKKTLDGIKELNNHEIEEEYNRIKMKSGCADFFDNLIRASFKSYVLFLTWDPKIEESMYTDNSIYEQIQVKDYIHKCYIISCEYFKENPELFLNSRSNKKDIFDIIKSCIEMAIKKSLPYNQILEDYLNIEFTKKQDNIGQELEDVKKLVNDIIHNKKYGDRPSVATIEETTTGGSIDVMDDAQSKRQEIEQFISKEKEKESLLETSDSDNMDDINSNNSNNSDDNNIAVQPIVGDSDSAQENIGVQKGGDDLTSSDELTLSISESDQKIKSKKQESESEKDSDNLTRSSIKSRELSELMHGGADSKTSVTENSKVNSLSKTSVYQVSSPPPIRAKAAEKLNELGKLKRTINVKENDKKNNLSNKFNQMESYYESMAK